MSSTIFKTEFILICFSSLFFSASYNMLISELPSYLSELGGAEYKGLIISLFTLTAGVSRPFSGRLTDTIGRKPVIFIGAMVCIICGLLYPIMGTVLSFFVLRFFHGFSTGFSPTGYAAYVSDISPKERMGEAMGIQSIFFVTGLALGPALGSFIKLNSSYNLLFYSSVTMALLSIIHILGIRETKSISNSFKFKSLYLKPKDIFDIRVFKPAMVTFLVYMQFGVVLTIVPDWSDYLSIGNKGAFFIFFTLSSIIIRLFSGKLSDIHGRLKVLNWGLILLAIAMSIIGFFHTAYGLFIGALIYGAAMGTLTPSLSAWTIDLSSPDAKGRAISTMFIALEVGIGLGALVSGWYFHDEIKNIPIIFIWSAILALFTIAYCAWLRNTLKSI